LNTYTVLGGANTGIYRNGTLIPGTNTIGINISPLCIDPTYTYIYTITINTIYKVTLPNGPAVVFAGSPTNGAGYINGIGSNALFNQPSSLCIDIVGSNLYVCDTYNGLLRKVNLLTSNVTTVLGSNFGPQRFYTFIDGVGSTVRFTFMQGITQGKSGLLYIVDETYGDIYTPYLRVIDPVALSAVTLGPANSTSTPANFFTNYDETTVYLPSLTGIVQNTLGYTTAVLAGSNVGYSNATGTNAKFNTPLGITFYQSNLLVVDSSNLMLRTVTPSSNVLNSSIGNVYPLSHIQNVSASSNSLYTIGNVLAGSNTYSALVAIPFANYPPTTYTFSNLGSTTQIQNTTGRPVTINVAGQTVTNPILPSTAHSSYIATLYDTGSGLTFI